MNTGSVKETFALTSVTRSTIHRMRTGKKKENKVEDKASRILGIADKTSIFVKEGPSVHLCGDSEVAVKWINGQYALGQKYRGRIGQRYTHGGKNRTSYLKDRRLRRTYPQRTQPGS